MQKLLRFISIIGHPIFMPSVGFILIYNNPIDTKDFIIFNTLVVIIPLVVVLYGLKIPFKNINLNNVKDRKKPILIEIISLILAWVYFYSKGDDIILIKLIIGIAISLIVNFILVLRDVKSSLHMTGILGLIAIQFYVNENSIMLYILICIALLIAISRYSLKAHTIKEILIGTIVGFTPVYLILKT